MFQEGIKINDLNGMGLVVERQDAQEETESLMVQLERLPCSIEGRWTILRALTEFETHSEGADRADPPCGCPVADKWRLCAR